MAGEQRRSRLLEMARAGLAQKEEPAADLFWLNLVARANQGRVIPIISNTLSYDNIFANLIAGEPDPEQDFVGPGMRMRVVDALAQIWAARVGYPLPDNYDLARVAQYHFSKKQYDEEGKNDFISFLKDTLLDYAEEQGEGKKLIKQLRRQAISSSFSHLARELELPAFLPGVEDPLRVLARLPLRMYVTTSYHDFIEKALEAEKKQPVSRFCDWRNPKGTPFEEQVFQPEAMQPLVYHLFGVEWYPPSMVLSEEDHLGFLVKVSQTEGSDRPIIPENVTSALKTSSLLLLGYRLMDWDFRVLMRGLLQADGESSRSYSRIIQLNPEEQFLVGNKQEARCYLETYFEGESRKFGVSWGSPESFVIRLWEEWNTWRVQNGG